METRTIGIIPTIGYSFEAMFAEKNIFFAEHQGKNSMFLVRKHLEEKGIELKDATKAESSEDIDLLLYFGNINIQMLLKFKDSVNIYLAFEPPAVDTTNEENNLMRLRGYFDYILTWNDDLVDGELFLKLYYSVDFFEYENRIPIEDRKLLTSISGCKQSYHKDELYSKRLEVINYFESEPQNDFEFWGTGWDPKRFRNYKGMAASKIDIYTNHKFAVCFENQKNLNGYITEKIWDCFICKIVPIYWGAENIGCYIPRGCYIDYRDYGNVPELIAFLKNISESEYDKYIKNIKNFLNSDGILDFKPEAFADTIVGLLSRNKRVQVTPHKIKNLKSIKTRLRIKNSIQTVGYGGTLKRLLEYIRNKKLCKIRKLG